MDRQLQDQLDESAGQEMVRRVHELSAMALCPSCGGNVGGLQHYSTCVSGIDRQLNALYSAPGVIQGRSLTARERYIEQFKSYTAKMLDITTKKNNDYGGSESPFKNFEAYGELGILVRMSDKMARLHTAIAEKRKFAVDESLADTAVDLANYAILLLCYMEAKNK